jgi:hypothetical protein
MYFHFRSRHALALVIVDEQTETYSEAVQNLLARKLSGLETLIDFAYLIAVGDITQDVTRASFNLLESVGRTEKLQPRLLGAGSNSWERPPSEASSTATSSSKVIRKTSDDSWYPSTWECGRPAIWTNRWSPWVTREGTVDGPARHRATGLDRLLHPIRQATYGSRDQGRPPTGKHENRQLAFVTPQLLGQILKCRERNLVIGTYQRRPAHERPHT